MAIDTLREAMLYSTRHIGVYTNTKAKPAERSGRKGGSTMKTNILNWYSFIVVVCSTVFSVDAYAVNFATKSEAALRGDDPGMNVKFSSVMEREDYVVVDIELRNEKKIVVQIDYAAHTGSIKSMSQKDGAAVSITKQDIFLLKMLGKSLGPVGFRTGDALASTLSFLSEAPPGEVVDISFGDGSIESLCAITGDTTTGRYDTKKGKKEQQFEETAQVGPCYNELNECLGRCGSGCDGDALVSSTVQRFTQDCLNHDLCRRSTGKNFGPCRDEWETAFNDFFDAPDCGDVTDTWNDNFGYNWDLNQNEAFLMPLSLQ